MTRKTARKTVLSTSLLPWLAAVCLASPALAQTAAPAASGTAATSGTSRSTLLDEVVVTATRTDETAAHVTSPYTKITGEEIQTSQITTAVQAVALSPGVDAYSSGVPGGMSSVSIWGSRPVDTLLLVDGVKASTAMLDHGGSPFLDLSSSVNLDDIEILRGAGSALYGSEAIGGVVSLQTRRGSGTPTSMVYFEGGSHDSFREGITSAGSLGRLDYSFNYGHEDSQNERVNNDLHVDHASARLDYTVSDKLTIGATVRTQSGEYHEPGDIYTNDPTARVEVNTTVVSSYIDLKATDFWESKLTLGTYQERYVYDDPLWAYRNSYESALYSLDWQNTFQITDANKLVAGFTANDETGHEEAYSASYESETREAVYLQDQWEIVKNLTLTAGGRYDHFELAGDAWTYRSGLAYFFEPTHTKLRASYGTSFKEPGFYNILTNRTMNVASLAPERSRNWNVGADQYLFHDYLTLGATFFHTNTHNVIDAVYPTSYTWYYINHNSRETQGVEVSAKVKLAEGWNAMAAYTYTDSTQTSDAGITRSPRIPRHMITLDTNYTFALPKGKLTLGGGAQIYADRQDSDWNFASPTYSKVVHAPDYTVLRAYAKYQFNDHLAFTARVENLANQDYQPVLGYPALGRTYYGGLQVTF